MSDDKKYNYMKSLLIYQEVNFTITTQCKRGSKKQGNTVSHRISICAPKKLLYSSLFQYVCFVKFRIAKLVHADTSGNGKPSISMSRSYRLFIHYKNITKNERLSQNESQSRVPSSYKHGQKNLQIWLTEPVTLQVIHQYNKDHFLSSECLKSGDGCFS